MDINIPPTDSAGPGPIDIERWDDEGGAPPDKAELRVEATSSGLSLDTLLAFARGQLVAMVEDARDTLVDQVRGLKSLTDGVADTLGEAAPPVRRLASDAGDAIAGIADALADKTVEELVEDGRELVRANPAAAVGIAIALGFLGGRMLKATRA